MTDTTSVKIDKHILEGLRIKYPGMSFNEIMELINDEYEYLGRTERPTEITKQVNNLVSWFFKNCPQSGQTPKEQYDNLVGFVKKLIKISEQNQSVTTTK